MVVIFGRRNNVNVNDGDARPIVNASSTGHAHAWTRWKRTLAIGEDAL